MLFFFNGVIGLILTGTIYLTKNAYTEKSYGKMMLYVLAGIIAFSVTTITKNQWKAQVKENVLAQLRQNQEATPIKEKFDPFEETNAPPKNIPLAKIPDILPAIITKNPPVNSELFESSQHKFRINIPKGWGFVQPDPPHKNAVFAAANKTNFDEMKVTILHFKNMSNADTFKSAGQAGRKSFLEGMLKTTRQYATQRGISIQYIGDGYITLNGEPTIWLTVHQRDQNNQQRAFYYFVAKNQRVYMISYFCSNEKSNQPQSDLVIDSINSLEFL